MLNCHFGNSNTYHNIHIKHWVILIPFSPENGKKKQKKERTKTFEMSAVQSEHTIGLGL